MTITQVNNRYFIETETGRLHVLNEKSLRWNLKRVFGMSAKAVAQVVYDLNAVGVVKIGA